MKAFAWALLRAGAWGFAAVMLVAFHHGWFGVPLRKGAHAALDGVFLFLFAYVLIFLFNKLVR